MQLKQPSSHSMHQECISDAEFVTEESHYTRLKRHRLAFVAS